MEREMLDALREAFSNVKSMSYSEFWTDDIDPEIDNFVEGLSAFGLLPKRRFKNTKTKIYVYCRAIQNTIFSDWILNNNNVIKTNKEAIVEKTFTSSEFKQYNYLIEKEHRVNRFEDKSYYIEPCLTIPGGEYVFGQ